MMTMTSSEQFLVIVLSVVLAIFLIIGIVALTKTIQILNHIKRIIEKAEKIADQAEAVGDFFQKTAGPAAIVKLVSNIVHSFSSAKHNKKENKL